MGFDYRTSAGLGKQTLGWHKQSLLHARTQEKRAVTPRKIDPDLPRSVQKSLLRHGMTVRGTEYYSLGRCSILAEVLLKEVSINAITPAIVWPQAKLQAGNTAPPISRKLN